jgi:hypothetical protein
LTKNKQVTDFPGDEMMVRRTVRAIQKAIEEDVPDFCRENHMETMNSVRYVRGDKINDNLRNHVVSEDTILISFKRYSWDGRMLIDQKNCITYTITTQQNLAAIPKKKNRSCPHFLQSILAIENSDLHGRYEQMALFPMEQFEDDVLKEDYKKIVSGVLSLDSGYHHYVVAYAFEKNELLDVKMLLLDKGFNTVSEISLNEFIKPDFAKLTAEQSENSEQAIKPAKAAKDLVAIKTGIRPDLIEFEDEKQA